MLSRNRVIPRRGRATAPSNGKTHWILIGNGARAALYSRDPADAAWRLTLEAEYAHEESRLKGSDLVSDRPGSLRGHGNNGTKYVARTSPKRNAIEHFARELAGHLDDASRHARFSKLTVVASNPLLGILTHCLTSNVKAAIDTTLAHDYTQLPERELRERLQEQLSLPAS